MLSVVLLCIYFQSAFIHSFDHARTDHEVVAKDAAADEHAASKAVGGIYFLRFLCPALLHPHAHGVTKEPPTEAAADQTSRQ